MNIILASASERRHELLKEAGFSFTVCESGFDEKPIMGLGLPPEKTVELISKGKLDFIKEEYCNTCELLVITADTVVSMCGRILGKPRDSADAFSMLSLLSGKRHEVFTGVSLMYNSRGGRCFYTFSDMAAVTMRALSDETIKAYISSGEPLGKAGAYNAGGKGAALIEKTDGDLTTVLGLPMKMLMVKINELSANDTEFARLEGLEGS